MKPEDLSPAQMMQLAAIGLILLFVLAASVVSWGVLLFRISQGFRFQTASRPTASIGFIDCLTAFLAVVLCFGLAISTWRIFSPKAAVAASVTDDSESAVPSPAEDQNGDTLLTEPIDQPTLEKERVITKEEVLGSGWVSVFQLLAAFITMIFVANRIDWNGRALGFSGTGFFRDLGTGAWVLFLMLPPIVMINIATSLLSGIEYNHPIIDAIKNYPWLVGVVAFQAVIVAPITEEFLFRVLLIGWFESAHFGKTANSILFGWRPAVEPRVSTSDELSTDYPRIINRNPYTATNQPEPPASEAPLDTPTAGNYSPPWWPAILSGILFGLAHFSYGVSWVPLVVFGVILGRVYQLRQSFVMCVAVHMLFNGINILNLWLSLGLPTNK